MIVMDGSGATPVGPCEVSARRIAMFAEKCQQGSLIFMTFFIQIILKKPLQVLSDVIQCPFVLLACRAWNQSWNGHVVLHVVLHNRVPTGNSC